MMRQTPLIVVLVTAIGLASCGPGASNRDDTGRSETTTTASSNIGGEVVPVQRVDERYPHPSGAISGVIDLQPNGCWTIDVGEGPQLALFPVGYEMTNVDEWTMGPAGGPNIPSGTTIGAVGGPTEVGSLPGGSAGFWANYLAFCDPSASHVIILDEVGNVAPPEAMTDDELLAVWEAADLSESWPCGLGFTLASVDQTVAIYVHPRDASLPIASEVTFPSESWEGYVVIGRDLLINHCDDVVEPDEPERIIDATWPLVAGTLSFDAPSAEGICNSSGDVEATLNGAAAQSASGIVGLKDLVIVNSSYGCFAG